MLGLKDWINRLRHNRGFGVQSPSDFYFVTQVLKEQLPYYAYKETDRIAKECSAHSSGHCRMLFRITNYFTPKSIIVIGAGKGATTCAMVAARPSATATATVCNNLHPRAKQYLEEKNCHIHPGNDEKTLQQLMEQSTHPMLIYVGEEADHKNIVATAMRHAQSNTVIIVDAPHRNAHSLQCWNEAISNPKATITFDLYSAGLLLFDDKRHKQHYTLKM